MSRLWDRHGYGLLQVGGGTIKSYSKLAEAVGFLVVIGEGKSAKGKPCMRRKICAGKRRPRYGKACWIGLVLIGDIDCQIRQNARLGDN